MRTRYWPPRSLRFWLRVYPRGDCWEWRGALDPDGYGVFWAGQGNTMRAHRVAFEEAHGAIPANLQPDHLCSHRWCVRPSHLDIVSPGVNTGRGNARRRPTHCLHGHPFDTANTYAYRGRRHCKACARIRQDRRRGKAA